MKKILLLTNILTPYRIHFYDLLFKEFKNKNVDFKVLVTASSEPNRNWNYEDFERSYTFLSNGKILRLPNNIFIHLNFDIKNFIREFKPDFVISAGTYLYPALWNILLLRKKFGYKVFYWSEAHLNEKRNYSKTKFLLRENIRKFIFNKFDGFWYSGKLSLDLINKYANSNSIKIFVPNLIDNEFFNSSFLFDNKELIDFKNKYNLTSDKIILVCPARLTWVKGQLEFLKKFSKSSQINKFEILFVGDGDLQNEIIEFAKDIDNVKFLGYKSQKEILELYSVSNALLLPSLSDPNPLTCIEALWCGLSLIVSKNVGNYPEVVKNGLNGYVFDYSESNSIENTIEQLSKWDESNFKKASEVSVNIANSLYDSVKSTKRIVSKVLSII